jgi:hypothetical protein
MTTVPRYPSPRTDKGVYVSYALKTAFGLTAQQVAAVLKAGAFTAEQVGAALKVAYGVAAQQAGLILRDIGFTPKEVGGVLIRTYKLAEKEFFTSARRFGTTWSPR